MFGYWLKVQALGLVWSELFCKSYFEAFFEEEDVAVSLYVKIDLLPESKDLSISKPDYNHQKRS